MSSTFNVMILIQESRVTGRQFIQGVNNFAISQPNWATQVVDTTSKLLIYLRQGSVNAVLGNLTSFELQDYLTEHKIPAINCSEKYDHYAVPSVLCDNTQIGKLAGDYLFSKGYRTMVCATAPTQFGSLRQEGFHQSTANHNLASPYVISETDDTTIITPCIEYIKTAQSPVGIFGVADHYASWLLSHLRKTELNPIEHYGIIGVDCEENYSYFNMTPVTSVDPNFEMIGYESASLIHAISQGNSCPHVTRIPPKGILEKETTPTSFKDPILELATSYIHEHACEGITSDMLTDHVGYSRRTIEKRFSELLNTTIIKYIKRIQMDKARDLLINSTHPIYNITLMVGYRDQRHFSKDFKTHFKTSPSQYRQSHRG